MSGEKDHPLVTAKAGTVIAEGLKVTQATSGGSSITPTTITAMVGISKGEALDFAPEVKAVRKRLQDAAGNVGGIYTPTQVTNAGTALTALTNMQNKLLPPGNHGAFGAFLSQAQTHINDSIEIKNATNFMANTNFSDLGSGITSMSSMVDQGMTSALGNISAASAAIGGTGKLFDLKNMSTFGTGAGLISQLNANKLGNATGVNKALTDAGVDLDNLTDPVYKDKIDQVLSSITDPAVLNSVKSQLEVSPAGSITNLKDLLDVNKVLPAGEIQGLTGGFSGIGAKFGDLSAKFANPAAAKAMLANISLPAVPKLDASASSLNSLMGNHASTIDGMIGKNLTDSPNGIPNVTDFMSLVGGGAVMKNLSVANIDTVISGVNTQITKTTNIMTKTGIDLDEPPPATLSSAMNFATGLHKFGADTSGSGVDKLLQNMANSSSSFGDSIKASLAEGKNKALMMASGMKPLDFAGVPAGEAAKNLQQGKFIPGTGSLTPSQINAIFGSGS